MSEWLPEQGQGWAAFAVSAAVSRDWLERVGAVHQIVDVHAPPVAKRGVVYISFESQQRLYERELYDDDSNLQEAPDNGSTGLELLLESGVEARQAREAAHSAGLAHLLDRGCRLFSTGETRLLLLLREVLSQPSLLILEEPFEGLDAQFRSSVQHLLARLLSVGSRWVGLFSRTCDLPAVATHWALLRLDADPLVQAQVAGSPSAELEHLLHFERATLPELPAAPILQDELPAPLIRMRNCAVRYFEPDGERVAQFESLNWELRSGEHTLITGPNGAGKSTLLQLLSGDHSQCYGNDLQLFGYQRGSGETVWDVKRHIGLVSPALHRDYRAKCDVLSVVVSGLYDSIGIYRDVPESDKRLGREWLLVLGLGQLETASFDTLPWSQQRLILIGRGLIKHPPLLILDEPTQGLDEIGRQLVLAFIGHLAGLKRTTLLLVTHRADEQLPLFRHRLTFKHAERPGVRFDVCVSDT